jgi:hypothetical protein
LTDFTCDVCNREIVRRDDGSWQHRELLPAYRHIPWPKGLPRPEDEEREEAIRSKGLTGHNGLYSDYNAWRQKQ